MPNIIYSSIKRRGIAGKRLGDVSEEETAAIKARASQPFLPFNEALLADDATATARSHHPTSALRKTKSSIKKVTPAVLHDNVWCLDGPQDSDEDEDETDVNLSAKIMNPVQSPSQPPTPVRHNLHETTSRRNISLESADNRVVAQGTDVVPPFAPAVSSSTISKNNSTTTTPTAPRSSSTVRSKRRSRKVTAAGIQAQKLQFSSAKHPHPTDGETDKDTATTLTSASSSSPPSCARCLQFGTELVTLKDERSQHQERMKQQTAQHQAGVDALRVSHQQELDQLTQQHADQIQSLTESHTQQHNEIKLLEESLRQQINELQVQHSRQIQDLRKGKERAEQEHQKFTKRQDALFERLAESLPGCLSPDQYDGNMEAWRTGVVDLAAADSVRKNVRIQDMQASSEKKERMVLDYREKLRQREAEISGLKRRLALVDPQYTTETNNHTNVSSGTGVAAREVESQKRVASQTPLQSDRDCKRRRRHRYDAVEPPGTSPSFIKNGVKHCADRQTPPFLRTIYAQDPFPFTQESLKEEEEKDKSTHRLLFPEYRPSQAATYPSYEEELPRLKLTKVNLKRAKKSKVARTPLVK